MVAVPGSILGGLPVIAEICFGYDSGTPYSTGGGYAEVDAIYWMKRNGSKGKMIPDHLKERAEAYDPYFAELIERATEHLIAEADEEADIKRDRMVAFDGTTP